MKEISPFIDKYSFSCLKDRYPAISDFNSESFDQKRKIGENEDYICHLIRNDSIVEFITYINQINISLNDQKIKFSIFETNCFLTKFDEFSLIEYAAFFGSIQIFKYLHINGVELSSSLWIFAIHGRNSEIIHFLEENHIQPEDTTYKRCMEESIKCHHNEIINYIKENFYKPENYINVYLKNLHNFNFIYLSENKTNDLDDSQILSHFCRSGCLSIINHFIDDLKVNFNSQIIIEKEKIIKYKYEIETTIKKYIASPIHFAVQKKNIELVTLLLKRNDLDINLKGRFITSVSTEAAEPESEEIDEEETALSIAIKKSDMKIIELLLKRKDIDINQKLNYIEKRESEEDCCCYVGSEWVKSEEVIKVQQSVIHIAICNKEYDIIKLLLTNQNIDLQSKYIYEKRYWDDMSDGDISRNENTPLELANKYRFSGIIALLKEYNKNTK
ncbi:hypothetical protein M9Y10_007111 [Tritrichomonas musculus]|uniref:DUF3447 domain-containing protein n=1 Tax=Tritrichomonas musculus TaxID=1915356 RepID=A0ABR2J0T5_9EUKA